MARNLNWLLERIDTESPGDTSVAPGATEATLFFVVEGQYLFLAYLQILGSCSLNPRQWLPGVRGGLTRQVEMSHPRYPYMYADRIDIVGVKADGNLRPDAIPPNVDLFNDNDPAKAVDYKSFAFGAFYDHYRIAVHFSTRNYFLLTDDQIEPAIKVNGLIPPRYSYWDRDITRQSGVVERQYRDYREYLRYTELTIEPHNEIISNTNGKLYWKSAGPGFVQPGFPWPKAESPVQIENAPVIFQNITKNYVRIKWYKVPKIVSLNPQYIFNAGKINYGPNFDDDEGDYQTFNYEFFNFAPGTLLFLGHEVEEVTTGMPFVPFDGSSPNKLWTSVINQQYVNISFNFMQFVIPKDFLVQPLVRNIANTTGKMYSNGWNFVPNPNKNFYYIESDNKLNKANAWPPYWSYPFQRMFDPQVT